MTMNYLRTGNDNETTFGEDHGEERDPWFLPASVTIKEDTEFGKGNDEGEIFGEDHGEKSKILGWSTLTCDTAVSCTPQPKDLWSLPASVTIEEDGEKESGLGLETRCKPSIVTP